MRILALSLVLTATPITAILADEIKTPNEDFGLPREISVTVEDCGEANAFYEVGGHKITICSEYAPELERRMAGSISVITVSILVITSVKNRF